MIPINAFLYLLVRNWIDYTDISHEGNYVALSTGRNCFLSWYKGQPDGKTQDCATNNYLGEFGQWYDVGCFDQYPPLCEASSKPDHKPIPAM